VLSTIFLSQAALFLSLSLAASAAVFGVLGALVLFCYGGSSGTMAAITADLFGSRHVGAIYGLMLTAWGFGGLLGPLVIAVVRESSGGYTSALRIIAAIMQAWRSRLRFAGQARFRIRLRALRHHGRLGLSRLEVG
jgi:MFS transporter, OFA family, oxalate/formate antiporter